LFFPTVQSIIYCQHGIHGYGISLRHVRWFCVIYLWWLHHRPTWTSRGFTLPICMSWKKYKNMLDSRVNNKHQFIQLTF
jgi:hypothetical protein